MHFYTTDTDVTLTGTKENIIRILNTAMRNAEADIVIAESDDLETMFQKVKEVDNNQQFLLPDFPRVFQGSGDLPPQFFQFFSHRPLPVFFLQ